MADEDTKKKVEAILFSAGRKVSVEEISKLCNIKEVEVVKEAIQDLKDKYESDESPILLIGEGDGYKLTVREKYLPLVKDITPHTELNKALLGTLAVIAWKQPILQSELVKVRTSNAYEHIRDLLEMGFISKERNGRSYLIKPTGRFFDYFDLPGKEATKEVFKDIEEEHKKAEEEIEEKLGQLDVFDIDGRGDKEGEKDSAGEQLGGLEVYKEKTEEEEKPEPEETEEEPEFEFVDSEESEEKDEVEEEKPEPEETEDESPYQEEETEEKDDEVEEDSAEAQGFAKKLNPGLDGFDDGIEEKKDQEEEAEDTAEKTEEDSEEREEGSEEEQEEEKPEPEETEDESEDEDSESGPNIDEMVEKHEEK